MDNSATTRIPDDTAPTAPEPPAARRPAPASRGKSGEIRDILEQEIVTGERPAGERLDEQAVASRFGVSRTPVREAINQLASAGLVEQIPNRGAFVRETGLADLVEMFEVMAELEAMAGRLAARRIDAKGRARLQAALEACESAAERNAPDAYYYDNERFHEAIYDACGNGFLASEARRLHQRLKAFRRLQLRVPQRIRQSLAEHRRIVAAIAAGDGERAEAELKVHIMVQGERFADLVASLKPREG
ncbi:GntR family transcriptional regulator [Jiella endophytica]|uniref:GntR family transcriptional regulator n=1 Tax=Jiella endophytica TaxID=2558362 RepID=A0A4Y8RVF1_9HYPH|nr:GntR family transcriptional regulator [Jiella endophytica]TFF27807.1 GntR family transcriptional regulator [Jiella endophytica]